MKKYIYIPTGNEVWLDVAIELYKKNIADPVLWLGDDRHYLKAKEVFGYSKEQAIGKIHMGDLFENDFSDEMFGAVDEFHARMESIEGKSFMVDVRLKRVFHNSSNYSIFVLRLIAEPG